MEGVHGVKLDEDHNSTMIHVPNSGTEDGHPYPPPLENGKPVTHSI